MKRQEIISASAIIVAMVALVLTVILGRSNSKVAFFRTGSVIEKYVGTKDAKALAQKKTAEYQMQYDTLKIEYDLMVKDYKTQSQKKSGLGNDKLQKEIQNRYEKLSKMEQLIQEKISNSEQQAMVGVLNQINAYSKTYCEKRNIKLLLGTTASGNIMYGDDAIDVTDDFVSELNSNYKGEQQ